MSTKYINPKNPFRREAAAQSSAKPAAPAQTRGGSTRVASAPVLNDFRSASQEQSHDASGQWNPQRPGSKERTYDARGEMNASDRRDAFAQTAFAVSQSHLANPFGFGQRAASLAEAEEQRRIITAAVNDPTGEGLRLVAQELSLPIKARIDHEGFIRKIYRVRTLQQAEFYRMPKDVRATAFLLGQDGKGQPSQLYQKLIDLPEVAISALVEIDMDELYTAYFDIFERGCDTARQEISMEEDKYGIRILDGASTKANTLTNFVTLNLSVLENLRYQVEQHNLRADKFLIHRQELSDIETNMSTTVDPVTQREWNLAGYVGHWLGCDFVMSSGKVGTTQEIIPAGTVYVVPAPEYLGEMIERYGLMTEAYNQLPNHQFKKGMAFRQKVGFGIPNVQAVAKAVKS